MITKRDQAAADAFCAVSAARAARSLERWGRQQQEEERRQDQEGFREAYEELPRPLLTPAIRAALPALYATEETPLDEKTVVVKFFDPSGSWTWYAVEGQATEEGGDFRFFGLVDGFEREWGYFLLSELEGYRGPLGIGIERDLHFKPQPAACLS